MKGTVGLLAALAVLSGCGVGVEGGTGVATSALMIEPLPSWTPRDPALVAAIDILAADPNYAPQLRRVLADPMVQAELDGLVAEANHDPSKWIERIRYWLCWVKYLYCIITFTNRFECLSGLMFC